MYYFVIGERLDLFMYGYRIFEKLFFNLNVSTQKRILKNIFCLANISEFNILVLEKKICFRFFERKKFIQFIFELQDISVEKVFFLENKRIFLQNYIFEEMWQLNAMSVFVKILLSNDEKVIYRLISLLL